MSEQQRIPSLGAVQKAAPVFAYVFRWDRDGRKGQRCAMKALNAFSHSCRVIFQDGAEIVVSRNAIVRASDCKIAMPTGQKGGRGSCQSEVQGADIPSPTPHTHPRMRRPEQFPTSESLLSHSQREAADKGKN